MTSRLSILLADGAQTRAPIEAGLRSHRLTAVPAGSGAQCLALVATRRFDLLLTNLQLPDMTAIHLLKRIRQTASLPFIVFSESFTVAEAVAVMRLGALDVIETPIDIDRLLASMRAAVLQRRRGARFRGHQDLPVGMPPRPRSVAERWATLVVQACLGAGDPKTLEDWAGCAGVSSSSLRETCRLVGIKPRDARNLARLLRVVIRSGSQGCPPEVLLDVSDRRTLLKLREQSGLGAQMWTGGVSTAQFLMSQQFVAADNEGLRVLRHYLSRLSPSPAGRIAWDYAS